MKPAHCVPLLLAVVAALAGCSKPEATVDPVRAVKLIQVGQGSGEADTAFAAEIHASTESRLGFRVAGKLQRRLVDSGQTVHAGQLLAVIDPQDYQLGAQAAVAQASAAQTQRDLAAADLKRYESLRDQGFVSGAEIDRRQAALRSAEATLRQAQAQAGVQGNQAAYTQLLADADGVIVGVEAEPGQVLAAGAPVVRLARSGPRDAVLALPEDRVGAVKPGMAATVSLWSQGAVASALEGTVREVAGSADPATRTFTVKVALKDSASPPLGATATVRLRSSSKGAAPVVKLPTSALWQQGQGSAVWVYDAAAGAVKARAVQVAGVAGNEVQISAGLQPGEQVVAAGVHVLTDGQAVTPYRAPDAPASR